MQVELVSPEAVMFSGPATQVLTRTTEGDIAFLEGHAPFIGALDVGEVQVWTPEGIIRVAAAGGFVEVSNNTVTVLSDQAVTPESIDAEAVTSELEAAQAALAANADDEDAAQQVKWCQLRLRVASAA
jgi:F-type H+-transporting ATPase subunit epsilon